MMATFLRKKLALPEAYGLKVLEVDSNSVYLRWAFLSTHSLTLEQLNALVFEFKTTDNSLNIECNFKDSMQFIQREFKARLYGLRSNTKYRFIIRCKLQYHNSMIYSDWCSRVEFQTKANTLAVITQQTELDIASLKHQLTEYQIKCRDLEAQNQALIMKMNAYLPAHHSWNYQQIVDWIMRIQDGLFKRYKETLLQSMEKEQIDGSELNMINMSDLQRLGVTQFAHKKILISHIHKLTENDGAPEYQYDHELAQTIKKSALSQQKPIARGPISDESGGENDDFANSLTPREAFPKQTTHFSVAELQINDSSNTLKTPQSNTVNGTMFDDNEMKTTSEEVPSLQPMTDSVSHSYGLTNSVKNLLLSSPENAPPKKWKYKNGVLMIKVMKATDVDNMDEDDGDDSASDPYVELELKGHYRKEQTKVIYNEANPVWNERFQLFPENPKKDVLKLKLWDKDFWTFDDEIGTVFVPVIDVLNANGFIKQAYDVVGSKCGAQLHLELKYKELQH